MAVFKTTKEKAIKPKNRNRRENGTKARLEGGKCGAGDGVNCQNIFFTAKALVV
jgi:hypothetical protein